MSLFKRKSTGQIKAEIRRYEREAASEERRDALESKRKAAASRLRELKYRKPLKYAGVAASTGLKLAGNAAYNLSRYDVSPQFKADFKSDSMVGFAAPPKKGRGGFGLL